MRVFESLAELKPLVGEEVAVSDWVTVTQQRIDQFAEATGDHQWIHVDPQRAAKGPFGTTIAHGYLTLSMLPLFADSAIEFRNVRMSVNYGLNRVRFTSPVPVGSELRARFRLLAVEDIANDGVQVTTEVTIERKGARWRPALRGQPAGPGAAARARCPSRKRLRPRFAGLPASTSQNGTRGRRALRARRRRVPPFCFR